MPHQPVAQIAGGFRLLIHTLTCALLLTLTLAGCGRTDPPQDHTGSDTDNTQTSASDSAADGASQHSGHQSAANHATDSATAAFQGQWLSIDNNMLVGLEFLPGHQLRTTHLRHAYRVETDSQTQPYTFTHDGRLTFTNLAGELEMYTLTATRNLLTLTPVTRAIPPYKSPTPSTSTPSQSYRYERLPANTSVAQAYLERWQARTSAYDARRRALETFMQQPGLLLTIEPAQSMSDANATTTTSDTNTPTPHESATVSGRIAMSVTGSRTRHVYAGRAWPEVDSTARSSAQTTGPSSAHAADQQPIQTGVVLSLKHLPQTHTSLVNISLDTAQLIDSKLARTLPATISLRVTGDADHLSIDDIIQNNFNQPQRITLTHDVDAHDVLVKKYQEETARRQTMTQAIVQTLKDYAVLKGQSALSGDHAPGLSNDTIYLLRVPSSPTPLWQGEIHIHPQPSQNDDSSSDKDANANVNTNDVATTTPRRPALPTTIRFAAATVAIHNNRPVLVIPAGNKTYTYKLTAGFQGHWSHTGFTTTYPSQMQVAQAMEMADYKANRKALLDKLNTITPQMTLAGFAPVASHLGLGQDSLQAGPGQQPGPDSPIAHERRLTPVTLNITIHPDDTVTAVAHYTLFRSRVNFTGKLQQHIQGPSIILNLSDIPPAQPNVRLSAALLARRLGRQQWHLSLTGPGPLLQLQGNVQGDIHDTLSFDLVNETWQARQAALIQQLLVPQCTLKVAWPATTPDELKQFTLQLDPVVGHIQGSYAGNSQPNLNPYKQNAAAPIQGRVVQHGIWPGVNLQITTPRSQYTMELIVFEHDNQPALSGIYYNTQSPQAETYLQLEKVSK